MIAEYMLARYDELKASDLVPRQRVCAEQGAFRASNRPPDRAAKGATGG